MNMYRAQISRIVVSGLLVALTQQVSYADFADEVEADEPAFWWRMDEGPNDDFAENSGALEILGGEYRDVELGVPGLIATDPDSTAARFDGEFSELDLGDATDLNVGGPQPWEEKSIVLWFQADDVDPDEPQVIFEQGGTTRGLNVYVFEGEVVVGGWNRAAGDGGGIASPWPTDNAGMEITSVSAPIEAGQAYQVGASWVFDPEGFDGTLTGFLNGEVIGEETEIGGLFNHSDDSAIGFQKSETAFPGVNATGGGSYFAGVIDEVAAYSIALPAERVRAQYLAATGGAGGGEPRLQAGDANQDLEFNQLDLVQVQIAAKYLTGNPATWGEGDWNGAPGGKQGDPPPGDGQFNQLDIVSALGANIYLTGPYAALAPSGATGDGQTSLVYNAASGELSVDAPAGKDLTSINITSAGGRFIGDKPAALDGAFDNFAADNVFKATFGGSFGSISFGNVLPAQISEADVAADLSAVGSLAGGGDLGNVDLVYIPEPSALVLLGLGLAAAASMIRRRR